MIPYKPYVRGKHVEPILGTCKNMTKKSIQFEQYDPTQCTFSPPLISYDPFWLAPNRLSPDGGKVGAKYSTSIFDVINSDRAVFQKVETYQTLEIMSRWSGHQALT
jgi:hypothetical protein